MNNLLELFKLMSGENQFESPKYNVIKKEKDVKIELVLPGFKKEDISIEMENNKLIVKAVSKLEDQDNNEVFIWRDFQKQSYEQTLSLPKDFTYETIEASYDAGILSIKLQTTPKTYNKIEIK